MKVAEIERLIQKITAEILAGRRLSAAEKGPVIALVRPLADYPAEIGQLAAVWTAPQDPAAGGLLVPTLSLRQIAAVAQLQVIDQPTAWIQQFLLAGKPVWVLSCEWSNRQLRQNARYGLYKKYNELLEQVRSYGLSFDFDWPTAANQLGRKKADQPAVIAVRQYLTEKQLLERMTPDRQVCLAENQYLTPLAADYVREHQVKIKGGNRCY